MKLCDLVHGYPFYISFFRLLIGSIFSCLVTTVISVLETGQCPHTFSSLLLCSLLDRYISASFNNDLLCILLMSWATECGDAGWYIASVNTDTNEYKQRRFMFAYV